MPDLDDRIRGALTTLAPTPTTADPLRAASRRHARRRQVRVIAGATGALVVAAGAGVVAMRDSDGRPTITVDSTVPTTTAEPSPGTATTTPVPSTIVVPTVIGAPVAQADAQLKVLGVNVVLQDDPLSSRPAGEVVGQDPPAGTQVAVGSTVTLTVANAMEAIVPQLAALTVDAATKAIQDAGFVPVARPVDVPPDDASVGRVIAQSPPAGSMVTMGTTVEFKYGRPPA
jgi:beta-lactam-binding protein with PASTA domain